MGLRFCHSGKMTISFNNIINLNLYFSNNYWKSNTRQPKAISSSLKCLLHPRLFWSTLIDCCVASNISSLVTTYSWSMMSKTRSVSNEAPVECPLRTKPSINTEQTSQRMALATCNENLAPKIFTKLQKWSFWSRKRSLGYKLKQPWSSRTL